MKLNRLLLLFFGMAMLGVVILVAGSRDDPGGPFKALVPLGRILLIAGIVLVALGLYFFRSD